MSSSTNTSIKQSSFQTLCILVHSVFAPSSHREQSFNARNVTISSISIVQIEKEREEVMGLDEMLEQMDED